MNNSVFFERLDLLREALVEGPVGSLADLAAAAEVSKNILKPGYRSEISAPLREPIAWGAAVALELDPDAVYRWLVEGEEEPELEDYVRWLPTQVRCTGCEELLDKDDPAFVEVLRRCRTCVQVDRRSRNPRAGRFEELMKQRLPEIRAVHPRLASAVQQTIEERQSLTYERLSKRALISVIEVARLLKSLGLDKRAVGYGVLLSMMLSTGLLFANPPRKCVLPRSRRRRAWIFEPLPAANDNAADGFSPLAEVA